jgi:hypothetical protein
VCPTKTYFESSCFVSNIDVPLTVFVIQGDSFGASPELIIINHAISYRFKRNLVNMYLGRCEHNLVTEEAEIGFLSPGDIDGLDIPC